MEKQLFSNLNIPQLSLDKIKYDSLEELSDKNKDNNNNKGKNDNNINDKINQSNSVNNSNNSSSMNMDSSVNNSNSVKNNTEIINENNNNINKEVFPDMEEIKNNNKKNK